MPPKRGKGKPKKGTPQKDNRRSKSVSSDDEKSGPVKLSVFRYDFDRILTDEAFAIPDVVKTIPASELNEDYYSRTGFVEPLIFHCDPSEIGMKMPKEFSVNDVVSYLGEKRLIEVVEVSTQDARKMSLKEFVDYYNTPREKRGTLYNVLSLEFSLSEMTDLISGPALVNKIDWITNHFPDWRRQRYLKFDDKSGLFTSHTIYPKVQKYCLMSVAGCYTDFHIDFGGSSVWYHVLRGQKVFWVIEPTDTNIRIYEEFNKNIDQTGFFGDVVESCARVTLNAGDTLMIPPGWIHAVYTPIDSLVFGGNFVHSMGASMQINVMQSENRIQISKKHRLPFFEELMLYVIADHVQSITGRIYVRPFQRDAYTYYDYVGKHWLADKRHHKKIVREDYPNLVHHDLIMQDDSSDDDGILRIVSDPEDRNRYAQYLMKDEENRRACISGLEVEDDESIFYDGGDPNILSPATSHRLHVFEEYEPKLNINDVAMEFISPKMQKELEYMLFYLKGRRSLNIPEGLNRCASMLSAYEKCLQRRRSILEDLGEELSASPWTRQGRLSFRRPPQPREKSIPEKFSHAHRQSRTSTSAKEPNDSAPGSTDSATSASSISAESDKLCDDEDDKPLAAYVIPKKKPAPMANIDESVSDPTSKLEPETQVETDSEPKDEEMEVFSEHHEPGSVKDEPSEVKEVESASDDSVKSEKSRISSEKSAEPLSESNESIKDEPEDEQEPELNESSVESVPEKKKKLSVRRLADRAAKPGTSKSEEPEPKARPGKQKVTRSVKDDTESAEDEPGTSGDRKTYIIPALPFAMFMEPIDFELDESIRAACEPKVMDMEPEMQSESKVEDRVVQSSEDDNAPENEDQTAPANKTKKRQRLSNMMDHDYGELPPDNFLETDPSEPDIPMEAEDDNHLETEESVMIPESTAVVEESTEDAGNEITVEEAEAHLEPQTVAEEHKDEPTTTEEEVDIVGEEKDEKPRTRGRARTYSNESEPGAKDGRKRGRPRLSSTSKEASKEKKKKEKEAKRKSSTKSFDDALNIGASQSKKKKHDPKKDKPQFVGGLPVAAIQDDPVVPNPYNYDPKAEIMKLGTGQFQSAYRKSRQNIAPPKDRKMYRLHHDDSTEHHEDEKPRSIMSPLSVITPSRKSDTLESPSPLQSRTFSVSSRSDLYSPTMSSFTPERRFSESSRDRNRPVAAPFPSRHNVSQLSTDASELGPSPRTPKTPTLDPRIARNTHVDSSPLLTTSPAAPNDVLSATRTSSGFSNGRPKDSAAVRKLSNSDDRDENFPTNAKSASRRERAFSSPEPANVPMDELIPADKANALLQNIVAQINDLNNA